VASACYALKSSTMAMCQSFELLHVFTDPSLKSLGKDFDLLLEPLIEELLQLWSGSKFNLCATMLWSINDYPALSILSGRTTKGYHACIHCDENREWVLS
jgi:hypothetical protein